MTTVIEDEATDDEENPDSRIELVQPSAVSLFVAIVDRSISQPSVDWIDFNA